MSISAENDPNRGMSSSPLVSATRFPDRDSQPRFIWVFWS